MYRLKTVSVVAESSVFDFIKILHCKALDIFEQLLTFQLKFRAVICLDHLRQGRQVLHMTGTPPHVWVIKSLN